VPEIFVSPQRSKIGSLFRQALSSYFFQPTGVKFETQGDKESIVLLLRKHWVTNIPWLFMAVVIIIIPLFVLPLLMYLGILGTQIPNSYANFLILIWYLMDFSYILVNFLLWYFTVSIVTDDRIVDIDFINILHKEFSATRIVKIEDVTTRRGGIIRTFLDYGDVHIQTAGTNAFFEFLAVPQPEKVARIINDLMANAEKGGAIHK